MLLCTACGGSNTPSASSNYLLGYWASQPGAGAWDGTELAFRSDNTYAISKDGAVTQQGKYSITRNEATLTPIVEEVEDTANAYTITYHVEYYTLTWTDGSSTTAFTCDLLGKWVAEDPKDWLPKEMDLHAGGMDIFLAHTLIPYGPVKDDGTREISKSKDAVVIPKDDSYEGFYVIISATDVQVGYSITVFTQNESGSYEEKATSFAANCKLEEDGKLHWDDGVNQLVFVRPEAVAPSPVPDAPDQQGQPDVSPSAEASSSATPNAQ
ncbi:hypothetical protein FACS189415_6390 [Bacteroidia bacterium]|nr:hypothetical protein FACS189415_6390 [Bacteroidia bacterium]